MGSKSCIDPRQGRRVFLEVARSVMENKAIPMGADLRQHVRECAWCQGEIEDWKRRAARTTDLSTSYAVVTEASEGNPEVEVRKGRSKTAYFRRLNASSDIGTLVIVEKSGYIGEPNQCTHADFRRIDID
jgi:hypothetical protein